MAMRAWSGCIQPCFTASCENRSCSSGMFVAMGFECSEFVARKKKKSGGRRVVGSRFQVFKSSRVQEFKSSRVQELFPHLPEREFAGAHHGFGIDEEQHQPETLANSK